MKGSLYDNNTMNVSLKLTLLNIRADENGMAHKEKEDEEFFDCESVTSNDDETTDHLNDSSEQRRFLLEQHNTIVHRKSKSNVTRRHNQEVSALMSKRDNKMNGSFITSESSNTSEETSIDSNSNDGKGHEHLFDTSSMSSYSSGEKAAIINNHCSFNNMSFPVI